MPRRRERLLPPREYAVGDNWPDGALLPDAPVAAHYAQDIARRLVQALGERSRAALAEEADLARSTLHDIATGRSWPDVVTLAKLENLLGARLWPERPLRR